MYKTFTTALSGEGDPPLVPYGTTFPRGGLWMLSHGAMSLQESIERFILPPLAGEVRHSRIGGVSAEGR